MRYQRTEVDGFVFVERDAVEIRQARYVDDRFDAFANTTFQFEHQVSGSGHQAGFFALFSQELQGFVESCRDEVIRSTYCY